MPASRGVQSLVAELSAVAVIVSAAVALGFMTGLIQSFYSTDIPPVAAACPECGVVESIRQVGVDDRRSGAGAAAGGLPGTAAGGETGADRGKIPATVADATGGTAAGNEAGWNMNGTIRYEVAVRMKDGSVRTITQRTDPALHAGDSVKVADNGVSRE
jgi:outer membrane lipoprotein SlyB